METFMEEAFEFAYPDGVEMSFSLFSSPGPSTRRAELFYDPGPLDSAGETCDDPLGLFAASEALEAYADSEHVESVNTCFHAHRDNNIKSKDQTVSGSSRESFSTHEITRRGATVDLTGDDDIDDENEHANAATMPHSHTEDDGMEHACILEAYRIQVQDLRHSLQYDPLSNNDRAAIQDQIQELEYMLEEGNNVSGVTPHFGQPDLGPTLSAGQMVTNNSRSDVQVPEEDGPLFGAHDSLSNGHDHLFEGDDSLFGGQDRLPQGHNYLIEGSDPLFECLGCTKDCTQAQSIETPCGHHYCIGCCRKMIRNAMGDENQFPPRCCVDLPEHTIARAMNDAKFMVCYKAKVREVATPINRRVYCCNPDCARYLDKKPPVMSISRRMCPACHFFTCTRCGTLAQEEGEEYHTHCRAGEHDQTFLDAVTAAGFQQCRKCDRWVELNFGCYHMTCLCGHQFCYLCGDRWKTCGCTHWDDGRLYDRAAQFVDRPPHRPRNPVRRRQRIDEMADYLRVHHECQHEGTWKRHYRRAKCEDCGILRGNILTCRLCHLRACLQCRSSRRQMP